ncbi:MAG: hypothetical protein MZV70_45410 [Desulfobacterales bacterium]|nr:hypothetical protein [Desulfobacterales bacterium]
MRPLHALAYAAADPRLGARPQGLEAGPRRGGDVSTGDGAGDRRRHDHRRSRVAGGGGRRRGHLAHAGRPACARAQDGREAAPSHRRRAERVQRVSRWSSRVQSHPGTGTAHEDRRDGPPAGGGVPRTRALRVAPPLASRSRSACVTALLSARGGRSRDARPR